jgi:uncharacterized protein (DUF2235 family)
MPQKRIAVCMDGTWSRLRSDTPTNIAKIARSVQHESVDGAKQIVIYTPGVGAADDLAADAKGALAGGLFGAGLEKDILDSYIRLCLNYQWGDDVFIFGYSRGAFSARSLGGLIRRCGIIRRRYIDKAGDAFDLYRSGKGIDPDDARYVSFRNAYNKSLGRSWQTGDERPPLRIRYMGLFDTVGQRGVPSGLGPLTDVINRKFEFHSLSLSSQVDSARHAMAIDEARFAFPPTLWDNIDKLNASTAAAGADVNDLPYQQRWFTGTHGDIGGGAKGAKLANITLGWVIEGAERMGLAFDRSEGSPAGDAFEGDGLDPTAPMVAPNGVWGLAPRTIAKPARSEKSVDPAKIAALVHESVIERVARTDSARKPYRPAPLRRFLPLLKEIAARRGWETIGGRK